MIGAAGRSARSKYLKDYRRAASARARDAGGRGKGFAQNSRDREKAEICELTPARVSRQVAVRATQAAAELTADRLEAARQETSAGPTSTEASTESRRPKGEHDRPARAPAG